MKIYFLTLVYEICKNSNNFLNFLRDFETIQFKPLFLRHAKHLWTMIRSYTHLCYTFVYMIRSLLRFQSDQFSPKLRYLTVYLRGSFMVARILRSLVDCSRIRSMDGHRKYHVFDSIEFVTAITYKLTGTIRYNKQFDFQVTTLTKKTFFF